MAPPNRTHPELIFAHNAPKLRQAGFAVLPANGKKPRRRGYRTWRYAPDLSVVSMWADQDPGADIVYVPGLSRARGSDHGIVVLDGDDEEACARITEVFGDTPGKVKTRRGCHILYGATDGDLGKLTSLKKFGINADVKHGNSIVVAPPSRHQDDRGFAYAWDGCNETVIRDLPPFNVQALRGLFDKARPVEDMTRRVKPYIRLRDGSRKLGLNDGLVANVWSCASQNELIERALLLNEEIGRMDPRGPLLAEEVMEVVRDVWRDRENGTIEKWEGSGSLQKRSRIEMRHLCELDPKHGPDALILLQVLRDEHSARCRRGETFSITPTSMAKAGVIPGWTRERFEHARDLLLAAGQIERVVNFKRNSAAGRLAGEFRLVMNPGGAGRRQEQVALW
jgi:Bifunctional DNA primase/polymerase, N-terminal